MTVSPLNIDILCIVLDNVPVTFDAVGQRKLGWDALDGASRASKVSRRLALKRWFSILRLRSVKDWEYLHAHIWIAPLVKEFHCSKACWKECYLTIRYATFNHDVSVNVRPHVVEIATSFTQLQTLVFDLNFARRDRVTELFLVEFLKLLPGRVASVTLMHSARITEAGLFDILANLPFLRVFDMGSCIFHCTCPQCMQSTAPRIGRGNISSWHVDPEFDLRDFAEKIPPLAHLRKIAFNFHLTHPQPLIDHINNHKEGLTMLDCGDCSFSEVRGTQEKEKTAVLALGRALPALKFVQLCSWGKLPPKEYTIRRHRQE